MNRQIASVQYVGGTEADPDYVYYNADIVNNTTDDQTAAGDAIQDPNIVFNETRDYPIIRDISNYNFSIVRFTMNGANLDLPLFIPSIREGTGQTNPNLTTYGLAIPLQTSVVATGSPTPTLWVQQSPSVVGQYRYYVDGAGVNQYVQCKSANNGGNNAEDYQKNPDPAINRYWSVFWIQLGPTAPATISKIVNAYPPTRFVEYQPQNKNPQTSPVPLSLANLKFKGTWDAGTQYAVGDIITKTAIDQRYATYNGPFYQVRTPQTQWVAGTSYQANAYVLYGSVAYYAKLANSSTTPPPSDSTNWGLGPQIAVDPATSSQWTTIGDKKGQPQDLYTDYYWVYTYQNWIDQINTAIFDPADLQLAASSSPRFISGCAMCDTYYAYYDAWVVAFGSGTGFPYATFKDFINGIGGGVQAPQIVYDPPSQKFSVYFDSNGFGQRLTSFTAGTTQYTLSSQPEFKLFFNTNLYNLFGSLPFNYWNNTTAVSGPFGDGFVAPDGYVYEILVPNKFYTNVADYRLAPYAGQPSLGYVPYGNSNVFEEPLSTLNQQKVYWVVSQETISTDTLWSPISSIVFASALMPVQPESNSAPVIIGQANIGNSQSTAKSAFTRIITDLALPMDKGAASWKSFIYYVPSAEYRLSDFLASHQPLSGIDVQVFWKNRLNNQLYPIAMTNLSSVSFKMMFKKKNLPTKTEEWGA
jgi:hypothetical protein